jgi:alkylation response protein AidB-like acyl-CoA dehydrogenase
MQAIGAPALGLPEAAGGAGVGMAELVVMAEEIGRSIASVPLIEHTVAARLLERLGLLDTAHDIARGVVDGTAIATLAVRPAVDGVWRVVPAGAVADVVVGLVGDTVDDTVVVTRSAPPGVARPNHACAPLADRPTTPRSHELRLTQTPPPPEVAASDSDAERTTRQHGAALSQTPRRSGVAASESDAELVGGGGGGSVFEAALVEWQLLTAAALVGIASTALDLGVTYATERHQFGLPIGSFQAVQHALADLPGRIEGARLLVHQAAWALDGGGGGVVDIGDEHIEDGATLAAMAFLFASDTASDATARSLHVHGGYGFSEEYDIQLLYRRARGWPLVAGDLGTHYQRLADRLLRDAAPNAEVAS